MDNATQVPLWLFGYGSLIWRVDFPFEARVTASLAGWSRRFWQRSTDHRGTKDAPGRVATLVEEPGAMCWGTAYRLPAENLPITLAALDFREKNGYKRVAAHLNTAAGPLEGIVYVADEKNPYHQSAPILEVAKVIAAAVGPSGANTEYLFELEAALERMSRPDAYVSCLAAAVRDIQHQR